MPHVDLQHGGRAHPDAPQAAAPDADGRRPPMASDDDELLQDGAAVLEQEGEVPSVDGDGAEAELPEAGEEHGAGREGAK